MGNKKLLASVLLASAISAIAHAADKKPQPAQPADQKADSEKVDVEGIKEKYWARGDESEMSVVQNRTYSKAKKFEFGLFGGFVSSDPFLSIKAVGGSIGYHLTEYIGFNVFGYKDYVANSSALDTFERTQGTAVNDNPPKYFIGGEAEWSFIYGKISLLGKKILYYDLHLLGGVGDTSTENGNYITPEIGVGQEIFLSQKIALRLDFRAMRYNERIKEKVVPQEIGQDKGGRINWTNTITLGLTFFWGPGK